MRAALLGLLRFLVRESGVHPCEDLQMWPSPLVRLISIESAALRSLFERPFNDSAIGGGHNENCEI